MLFGNKIRALRDEQGVLQRQLAAYLENRYSHVQHLGNAKGKQAFLLYCARFALTFNSRKLGGTSAMQKKNKLFFCIALGLH